MSRSPVAKKLIARRFAPGVPPRSDAYRLGFEHGVDALHLDQSTDSQS